jgi:AraC family transcriptional regulator, regulatory protein of adaptative response / methylated-DNA-[protein]-cysteine methyltransferase
MPRRPRPRVRKNRVARPLGLIIMVAMNDHTASFLDSRDFARIARAIRFIDENFRAQPRLATIAQAVHLSEFHFNRLFRRWAGITPRQYLAFVTARAARGALSSAPSVLEAAYAVGLSAPSRLHDLMVTLEAVTPGELRSGGAGLTLTAGFTGTPFGRALIGHTARGIAHLAFVDGRQEAAALGELAQRWPQAQLARDDAAATTAAARIFEPSAAAAPLRLAVQGTNFQLKVWRALLESCDAPTVSYAQLARAAGVGAAARAVGNAVGANPIAWLIPCHKVLRQDGALGGYHWGTDRKRAMLAWSAVRGERRAASAAATGQRRQAT